MFQDLRYAARVLLRNKGWTSMVLLSLAIGIGANTALFSAINGMLLNKLPVHEPDTLVRFRWAGPNDMATNRSDYGGSAPVQGLTVRHIFSYPMYQQFLKSNRTFSDIFACAPLFESVNAVVDGAAEVASALVVSGNYHGVLGITAVAGRTITPEDDQPGATPVAVISHGYWTRRFGKDPGVVGSIVEINNTPVNIVGVLPPEFTGVQRVLRTAPDISMPLAMDSQLGGQDEGRMSRPTYWWLQIMGRLKPGVTPQQALVDLQGVFQQTAREGIDSYLLSLAPEERAESGNRNRTRMPQLLLDSAARGIYDAEPENLRTVTILTVVVALLLLMVCANVANLLLSRAAVRQKEISVRLSMGATRPRLVRQLLTESIVLAAIGGGLGLLAAAWGKELLPAPSGQGPLDWRVLLFTTALALTTGVLFGLAPALRATRSGVNAGLKQGSRNIIASRTTLGKSLVIVQVAISVVLVIGAGLFVRTMQNLHAVDVGFNPQNIVLFRVNPRLNRYDEPRITSLYERIIERVKNVPGVQAVSFSNSAFLSGSESDTNLIRQGRTDVPSPENVVYQLTVSPGFFETMEIPLVAGRTFKPSDNQSPRVVAVINEMAAKTFFPIENPLGQRFGTSPETNSELEIVGIVRDVKYNRVREAVPPTVYFPTLNFSTVTFEVRTARNPANIVPEIRNAVRQVDSNLPLMNISTQMEQIDNRFFQERIFAQAYALFGTIALLLASIGLFGLMSYSVARRTNEIGIRLALGAQNSEVLRMVMRESLFMLIVGLAVGLAAALIAGRFIASLLFGLAPTDSLTIAMAMILMICVSALAAYLPARRASRVDPMVALRYE